MPHSGILVEAISVAVKRLDVQIFTDTQNKRIITLYMFKNKATKVGDIMTLLVEVKSTWLVHILAPHILFVFSHSCLKLPASQTHIFTF